MDNQFERFSEDAKKSLIYAQEIAAHSGSVIDTAMIIYGFLKTPDSVAGELLLEAGMTAEEAQKLLVPGQKVVSLQEAKSGLSNSAQKALEAALALAYRSGDSYVGTEHILIAILSQKDSEGAELLKKSKISIPELNEKLEESFKEDVGNLSDYPGVEFGGTSLRHSKNGAKESLLEKFSTNITKLAKEGNLDPVIGRDKETSRIISILNRRTKNNPVLIGEPGVGKTAIVEGLAQKIVSEEVPEMLLNKQVLILDLPSVVAGTKYRGEFEERLMNIIREVKNNKNIILFIDEIHNLVGAGAAEGAIDAANILKPALSRAEMQVIGATTLDEYRKYIEKDAALERRFQSILVAEPSVEETINILKGLRSKFDDYHNVKITDEALEAAARLSSRYIPDRFLPDKAIDLIDEAASLRRVKRKGTSKGIASLNKQIKEIINKKEDAVLEENFEHAAELKQKEDILATKLKNLKRSEGLDEDSFPIIDGESIAEVISISTGVPTTRLVQKETESLLNLENLLKKKIVGQDEAVEIVASAIRRSRTGVSDTRKPIGSFMFLGPTGVGKTELAKILASEVYGDPEALVKVDMSEFMEKHNVSRLVGAPAGYVGFEESGQLTETIRRRPYSVVLLDEIEKAHPDVFNILLQIFEDGYLTDAKGLKIDFRNTIIIMTSNVGAARLNKEVKLGFSASTHDDERFLEEEHQKNTEFIMEDLKKQFKPEFLNRLDKIVIFRALTRPNIKKIVNLQINELAKRLAEKSISINITEGAKSLIVEKGYDINNGARPIKRVIQNLIEDPLANGILSKKFEDGDKISVLKEGSELKLYVLEPANQTK
ncbi:MAG: ATP-dependent Clp protease ATP-binding subunit [Patescibacteria group bacterium]|nr:ATP-dependent Clp protease ATP-binding subunit [Patescibacteria group bacterium]